MPAPARSKQIRWLPHAVRRVRVANFIGQRVVLTMALSKKVPASTREVVTGTVITVALSSDINADVVVMDVLGPGNLPVAYSIARIVKIEPLNLLAQLQTPG